MKKPMAVIGSLSLALLVSACAPSDDLSYTMDDFKAFESVELESCPEAPAPSLHAQYALLADDKSRTIDLYRRPGEVLHVGREPGLAEYWRLLPNGRIAHTRYFEDYQRGIEYEPADLNSVTGTPDWATLGAFSPLRPEGEIIGAGCNAYIKSRSEFGDIVFSAKLELLEYRRTYRTVIRRTFVDFDPATIDRAFETYADYDLVDFADIGDMEDDLELSRMMSRSFMEKRDGGHSH